MLTTADRDRLKRQLESARALTDELFTLVRPEVLYERPIAERHRIVFYLGHLETFDWNMICVSLFGMKPIRRDFDELFAFGIDPTNGNLPQDQPGDWPGASEIHKYNLQVREAVDRCLHEAADKHRFQVTIEHRLMHAETLTYMLHRLPPEMLYPRVQVANYETKPVIHRLVEIPSGVATLGIRKHSNSFGWDNEFEAHAVQVPAFVIDAYKVTNADYLAFVRAGGYEQRAFWNDRAWEWINRNGLRHPVFWRPDDGGFRCRTIFGEVPFQPSWPIYVSQAEAEAYARWQGRSLPTEAQFHRAAFGVPDGTEREYPWGNEPPQARHGNFDFHEWEAAPVNAHPAGDSAFGVSGLVGNGWEWTRTPFAPFQGFQPFDFYPNYSADFFDGNHYVMKGGSARTAASLLRRSFRNFFQPLYPYTYTGFRCVDN